MMVDGHPSSQLANRLPVMPQHLLDCLDYAVQRYADRPAYSQRRQTLSFATIDRLSRNFAAFLQAQPGLKVGDRVAVQLPSILPYPVAALGVLKAGMVLVNCNPLYTARETLRHFQDAGVKAWVCAETSTHLIAEVQRDYPLPLTIVTGLFDLHSFPRRQGYQFVAKRRLKIPKVPAHLQTIGFRRALREGGRLPWQRPLIEPSTLALLQYTGGSSGVLKAAMLSHSNIVANMLQMQEFLRGEVREGEELVIAPLPLSHIFAFTVHIAMPLLQGAHNVLIADPQQIASVIEEMQRWTVTSMTGVNPFFQTLLRTKAFQELDFSHLRFAIAGGMKLDPEVGARWQDLTGSPLLEGFGMTELSPVSSLNHPLRNRLGTIGQPLPRTEYRLLDSAGQVITRPDQSGELCVRGPQVMQGYWQQAEETAAHLGADGWMRTGDLASFDTDGYWRIVGRSKRMILVSGFNVYPQEVEAVLANHPAVIQCRVVGVPHAISGELVKAFIVARAPQPSVQELKEFCRRHLTAYKIPRQFEFCTEIADFSPSTPYILI